MKKLLAILLSVLLLCTMIPFATVFAADENYIELVADAEEVDAGDEVAVEVYLYGHESVGLIGAQIELGFDHDVFELVTYYDEDEEMWMPPIEVGPKFSASSNKYIMFSPIDEETGYMDRCLVQFLRATATATQAVKTNLFYTVTFKVKDNAPSGEYELYVKDFMPENVVSYGNLATDYALQTVTITVNGSEPSCQHEYNYDCDKVCAKCGEETRPEAEHEYASVCDKNCSKCGEETRSKPPHEYVYACDQYCNECGEKTRPRAKHTIVHVEAKPAVSCTEFGNLEYWYCSDCDHVWLDEDCNIDSNKMSVMTSTPCVSDAEYPCQNRPCIYCGMDVAPDVAHKYDDEYDVDCNVCGDVRVFVYVVKTFGGNSVAETNDGLIGLAFRFNLTDKIEGLAVVEGTKRAADYSNAYVSPDSTGRYKLVTMGAIVSNELSEKDIPVQKIVLDDADGNWYAIRIINIPEDKQNENIYCVPYYVYDVDGDVNTTDDQVTVYGEEQVSSYNSALQKAG